MPIHDQGYHRYAGSRGAIGTAWQVIAQAGIRTVLAKRKFLALLLVSWAPFVVNAIRIYIASNFQQASFLAPKGETFREFLETQKIFVFFVTVYVGAGLIAADRRANALQLYLSKPLTAWEYVAGKLAILCVFLTFVTLVPAMLLLLVQIMFAGSLTFLQQNAYLVPAITLFSVIQILLAASTMLALSSLSKSSRFVGVMYAGLFFFTTALFQTLRGITGRSTFAWLSPTAALQQLGDVIFRLEPRYQLSPAVAAIAVVIMIGGSIWILMRRVRGVEIVA
jgi:ABC-type transport system involved in multi-copper enzyme maturation permease subunit